VSFRFHFLKRRLTLAGASGTLHLHSKEPLFKRLVSMSATSLMFRPLPVEVSEIAYASAYKALDLDNLSGPDRVKALLNVSVEHLLTKVPSDVPLMPVIDEDILAEAATYSQVKNLTNDDTLFLPGKDWCEDLLIGDCQFDVSASMNAEFTTY